MVRTQRVPGLAGLVACLCAWVAVAQELRHEKYTLPNGMTVILHQDRSLPRACVNLWYRVGARNEPPGRSGFAHLFEHLMFMGTKRVPGSDFDVLMETGGGSNNATTSLDRTNYFSSGPSSLLPTLLWLEADRLEDMGLEMTQEKLDKQRDVVRNERRQMIENAPYGKAYDASYGLLFPPNHPYHNGVMGTHSDLEAATVQDVKDFFARFYQPNNCSLVVAGDFDPALIKPMINDLFGTLPAGNVSPQEAFPTPRLATVVRTTTLDKVQLPAVMISHISPALFAEGDAEMDIAGAVLADGNGSRLYQRLVVKEQLASEVSASQESAALQSIFRITILCNPEADLGKVEAIVEEEIAALASDGPTPEELERSRAKFELDIVSAIQSIEARADRLNQYEYSFGTPDGLQRDLNRYRDATRQGVRSWVQTVLRSQGKLVQRVLPEEPQRAPSARDTRPAAAPTAPFTPPTPERFALANGMNVMVLPRPGLPLVAMSLVSKSLGPVDSPEKAGCGAIMAAMIEEGPQGMTSKQFADEMALIGASFAVSASQETVSASMSVLKRGLDRGAALFAGALRQPRMDSADFERVKNIHVDRLRQADDNPAAVASRVASRMLLGKTNPYGTPAAGTLATAQSVTLSDAQAAYTRALRPEQSTLVISGDVTKQEASALAERHFASWTAGNMETPARAAWFALPETSPAGMRVYIVDRPDAVQTVLHLCAPGIAYSDPNRTRLELVNTILGGSFTSRLNMNLREKNGYTYGARSGMIINPSLGVFSASTSVKAEQTGAALAEFLREIRGIREGNITPEEAAKARETVKSDAVGVFGTASDAAEAAVKLAMHGAPWSTIAEDIKAYDACDAATLNAVCGRIVDLDKSVLVLVGDKALVAEQIKPLNLPEPLLVDASGEPVQ